LKNNLSDNSNQKGFSFIEVLISITILALIVVGILTMTTVHIRSNSFAQHHTKAVQLAEEGVENMMRIDFDQLATYGTQSDAYGTIPTYPDFARTTTATAIDPNNYRLTAQVTWISQGRNSSPVTLTVLRTAQ
jgi:prepilin-type N-terminal cleavage/methylation domain-containing protein